MLRSVDRVGPLAPPRRSFSILLFAVMHNSTCSRPATLETRRAIHAPLATVALVLAVASPPAAADINDWASEVAVGTPVRYVNAAPVINSNVDIGPNQSPQHATYELIFNAGNYNGGAGPATTGSSALIGVRNSFVGDQAGAKFEQWFGTAQYGVTQFGIADFNIAPNTENTNVHVVFVCNTSTGLTTVYENGVNVGTAPYAFRLAGMVGIGQVHDPTAGDADPLAGQLYGVAVYDGLLPLAEIIAHRDAYFQGGLGTNYCTANPNSTGAAGSISATGSLQVASNNFVLAVEELPLNSFGFFLVSRSQGFVPMPGGSQGNLCLSGAIGRFQNQIQSSGATGSFSIPVNLTAIPTPTGTVAAQAGDTWNFQAWHRDAVGGVPTSNFTDGLGVLFQ
jgi:hypothetical protein